MAKQIFFEFFLPSTIPDRKSAAHAVAAGSIAGFIMLFVVAAISLMLFVRQGSSSMSVVTSITTVVMVLVTVGTWKRIVVAPDVGLVVASAAIAWEISHGKIGPIVLIVPLLGVRWATTASPLRPLPSANRRGLSRPENGRTSPGPTSRRWCG
jgi:cell division protein FtsW (lipid II flippase)